jgi:hypothetical protein
MLRYSPQHGVTICWRFDIYTKLASKFISSIDFYIVIYPGLSFNWSSELANESHTNGWLGYWNAGQILLSMS